MNKKYFFVRGFVRSGTNWVCNLLNLHPKIFCNGEYHFFRMKSGIDEAINLDYCLLSNGIYKKTILDGFEETAKKCMELKNSKASAVCFGDRTAIGIEPIIIRNTPQIYIIRDLRDIIISYTYHLFRTEHAQDPFRYLPEMNKKKEIFRRDETYFVENKGRLLEDLSWVSELSTSWVKFIKKNNGSIKNQTRLLTNVHIVKYEDLHSDIENQRNKMYNFLGVDPMGADKITELTAPGFKKENFSSHYRKGFIGDWISYFTDETKNCVKKIAGQVLIELGYEKNNNW